MVRKESLADLDDKSHTSKIATGRWLLCATFLGTTGCSEKTLTRDLFRMLLKKSKGILNLFLFEAVLFNVMS